MNDYSVQGWFLRAQGFAGRSQILWAGVRALAFVALWALAFASLPTMLVAVALAAWVAWIVPKVRFVNREFQHVASG